GGRVWALATPLNTVANRAALSSAHTAARPLIVTRCELLIAIPRLRRPRSVTGCYLPPPCVAPAGTEKILKTAREWADRPPRHGRTSIRTPGSWAASRCATGRQRVVPEASRSVVCESREVDVNGTGQQH